MAGSMKPMALLVPYFVVGCTEVGEGYGCAGTSTGCKRRLGPDGVPEMECGSHGDGNLCMGRSGPCLAVVAIRTVRDGPCLAVVATRTVRDGPCLAVLATRTVRDGPWLDATVIGAGLDGPCLDGAVICTGCNDAGNVGAFP